MVRLVLLEQRDRKDLQAQRGLLVHKEPLGRRDQRVILALLGRLEPRARPAQLVLLGRWDLKVHRGRLGT